MDNFKTCTFECDNITKEFKLDEDDKDKYLVVCIAKGENDYIIEWIEHYLRLGFDKIIIGDNNDDDSMTELLKDYINKDTVQLLDCHGFKTAQIPFYTFFAEKGNYKWCAYYDCDEFLEFNDCQNIKTYLNSLNNCDCVLFNWMVMSNDGHLFKKEGSVQNRFPYPLLPITYSWNWEFKSLVRGGKIFKFENPHIAINDDAYYSRGGLPPTKGLNGVDFTVHYKDGYLKHYRCKSYDECVEKYNRGYGDGGIMSNPEIIFKSLTQKDIYTIDDIVNTLHSNPVNVIKDTFYEQTNKYDNIVLKLSEGHKPYTISYYLILWIMQLFTNKNIYIKFPISDEGFANLLGFAKMTNNKIIYTNKDTQFAFTIEMRY